MKKQTLNQVTGKLHKKDVARAGILTKISGDEYYRLAKVFRQANSIMFIDPHLDPSRRSYREFGNLFWAILPNKPAVEIHRVCWSGSGPSRTFYSRDQLAERFSPLDSYLRGTGIKAKVFVWDDFSLADGFDISGNPNKKTSWTRLGRLDKDDVQREFDPSARRHIL